MVKLTKADHFKYMKAAVEVTKNCTQAAGHGPMIQNIYNAMCKMHEDIPEDDSGAPSQEGA